MFREVKAVKVIHFQQNLRFKLVMINRREYGCDNQIKKLQKIKLNIVQELISNTYYNQRQIPIQFDMQRELFDIDKQQIAAIKPNQCMNINVGVLGHVDSGKTSICRVLTQIASTASLDKSPQSKQRGITLDLGFSSFITRVSEQLQTKVKEKYFQFTLVDCPGHASLIRTIIGGAQIIDLMFLVVDINKGIQTQTAECIIIAEMFIKKLIIVLNKVDCLQEKVIPSKIAALRKVFSKTKFGQNVTMIPYSAKQNVQKYCRDLKATLLSQLQIPKRQVSDKKFTLLADHCFKIKGKGTILTGTVIEGRIKVGDEIQICEVQQKSKIKSMEIFRKPVNSAQQGDRVAMLMTHLQAQNIQRAIVCLPNSMRKIQKFVVDVNKVRLYKRPIKNKMKFHIISGHQTVMGELRLFYSRQKKLNLDHEYLSINDFDENSETKQDHQIFATISLEKQMWGVEGNTIIGYKYDIENDEKECRIAFHGTIQLIVAGEKFVKLYKDKVKKGVVDRVVDNYTVIIKDLFAKDVDVQQFVGKEVLLSNGDIGKIDGAFGKSGKVRVLFKQMLKTLQLQGQQVTFGFKKWYH